jgi:type I restriction-modification system DNA methylase subunit
MYFLSSLAEILTEAKQLLAVQEQESTPVKREHRIVRLAWLCFLEWQPSDSAQQAVRTYLLDHCGIDTVTLDASVNQPYRRLISLLKPLVKEHPGIIYNFYGGLLELLDEDTKHERSRTKRQRNTRTKKQHTFFYTPLAVAHFMIDILNPQSGEKIHDPASGSCGLLIEASRKPQPLARPLLGCERDPNALALGVMHMALHNLDISGMQCRDALVQPQPDLFHQEQQIVSDVHAIVTHPSFGGDENQSKDEKHEGVPPYCESRILKHCMDVLNKHGRCVMIATKKMLSYANEGHIPLRKRLFHNYTIQMIVGLPPKTFGEHSNYPTFLLVFAAGGETQQTLYYYLPRKEGPVCATDFVPIRAIWPEWLMHLEGKGQVPPLPEGAWIENYEDLRRDLSAEEEQETQAKKRENPYNLVCSYPQKIVPLESPRVLAERIVLSAGELRRIAQKLQEMLDQKELDAL